jgi:carbamoylphosphate synthase small subunit
MSCGPPPEFAQVVMYADDGIFYSDKPFDPAEVTAWFENVGVKLNEEKSG